METRERIIVAAREMKYRPSPSARALSTGRTRQIALSGADAGLHRYQTTRLIEQQGVIEAAAEQRYRVVVLPSTADRADSGELEELLYTSGCDGFCLYAEQGSPDIYALLRKLAVPFVVIGNPGDDTLPRVDHDNYRYAYESVAWLREQGHTHIAFADFLAPDQMPFARVLHSGYRDAMDALCGGFKPHLIFPHGQDREERAALLLGAQAPTAIILSDWASTVRWQSFLQPLGLRVPDDLTILAHIPLSERHYLEPGFAYHAHDPRAVGLNAGRTLIETIESDESLHPQTILVPPLAPQWQTSERVT